MSLLPTVPKFPTPPPPPIPPVEYPPTPAPPPTVPTSNITMTPGVMPLGMPANMQFLFGNGAIPMTGPTPTQFVGSTPVAFEVPLQPLSEEQKPKQSGAIMLILIAVAVYFLFIK